MIVRKDFCGEKIPVSLTIGFFDGIHLGHQEIIHQIVEKAKIEGLQSCVVTFDRHPSELFSSSKVKLLTCWEEKKRILSSLGIDVVQLFTFNLKFAHLSPLEFLRKLSQIFTIKELLVGKEFTFGFQKKGNVNFLLQNQSKFGYRLRTVSPLTINGEKISSSLLRDWLSQGNIEKVIEAMGRPPTILGKVVPGKGRGRKIGYPTANLEPHPQKLLPPNGVYAGCVELKGEVYKALVNVGNKPTFGDLVWGVEVHIMDFSEELYGEILRVNLIKKIRDIQVFPTPSCLMERLKKDKEKAERILEETYF